MHGCAAPTGVDFDATGGDECAVVGARVVSGGLVEAAADEAAGGDADDADDAREAAGGEAAVHAVNATHAHSASTPIPMCAGVMPRRGLRSRREPPP